MTPGDSSQPSKQRTGLFTLLFTDVVGSTQIKSTLGDQPGVALIQTHHRIVRELLRSFPEAREINTAGDSFLLLFAKPSDALRFALQFQFRLRQFNDGRPVPVEDRIGLHMGEVVIEVRAGKPDVHGMQVDTCARVMSLAQAGQILMTRPVFDNARQTLKGEEIDGAPRLEWLNHGRFELKGVSDALEICEVRAGGTPGLAPPTTSEKARRAELPQGESVLGWRPAVGQAVPNTQWILQQKLGEGGFGEVWLGSHQRLRERRVFKFCFRADRVRSLKREMTLFRLIKERIGDHPNIVRLLEVNFEQSPFYVEEDFVAGQDLAGWCEAQGGADILPLHVKLEIIAQIADALQAAHDAGVIHRDVKPGNILVCGHVGSDPSPTPTSSDASPGEQGLPHSGHAKITAKLTDFGIGQVISAEALSGVTKAGFTQTLLGSDSSSQTGTHLYMAPELLAGKPASTRSDIYSLGVVFFQLFIGDFRRPLTTDWGRHVEDELLRADLQRCFCGNPEERFAGAAELARALRTWKERKAELARRLAEQALQQTLREQARRRHRLLIAASGTVAVLLAISAALLFGLRKAEAERDKQRQYAYAADMNLAFQSLEENNLGRARELLSRHEPRPGETDLRGWEWRHLWQCSRSDELYTFGQHSRRVYTVAFSPDGRLLATGGGDKTVRLWDVASRHEIASVQVDAPILEVAFSPDGTRLYSAADGGTVRVHSLSALPGIQSEVVGTNLGGYLTVSPDGGKLAIVGRGPVKVWDLTQRKELFRGPEGPRTLRAAFSPDGSTLAAGTGDTGDISIWNVRDRTELMKFKSSSRPNHALAFSPDGHLLASGGWDRAIRIWSMPGAQPVTNLIDHTSVIVALSFSPDGRTLASCSKDQTARLWDTKSWQCKAVLRGHLNEVWDVDYTPDGKTLATGSKDETIKIWSNTARPTGKRSSDVITNLLALSQDGYALTLDGTSQATVLDCEAGKELSQFTLDLQSVNSAELSMTGRRAAFGTVNGTVDVVDASSGRVLHRLQHEQQGITFIVFSPAVDYLAVSDARGAIKAWKLSEPQEPFSFNHPESAVTFLSFSPDSKMLAAGDADGAIEVWNIVTRNKLRTFRGHKERISGVLFDKHLMFTSGWDAILNVWDLSTGKLRATLGGQMLAFWSLALSPELGRFAAGGGDGTIKMWDLNTLQEVGTLKGGHLDVVGPIAFSRSGNSLISYGDSSAVVWRAPPFADIHVIDKAKKAGSKREP